MTRLMYIVVVAARPWSGSPAVPPGTLAPGLAVHERPAQTTVRAGRGRSQAV